MRGGQPAVQLSTSAGPPSTAGLSPLAAQVVTSPGAGDPLLPAVREALESSLEVPLYPVRVHTDARSAAAVDSLGARAFTYGMHVFLGARERPADLEVMAHEVAHVVQQQGRPVLQMAGGASTDAFEQEAQQTAVAVQRGEQATVRGRTDSPRVQGIWPVDEVIDWAEDKVWDLLNRFAPELVPIIREGPSGVLEWIKDKIVSGFETLFDTLMAPVRAVSGAAQWLSGHFANLLTWMREAATKISQGDCKPISEAAAKIQQVVENFVTPIVDKVKHVASKIGDFFKGVWDRFGAPIWNLLRTIGGRAWEKLQQLGTWIWEKTAPVRRALSRAWKWIKDKLGIGEGPEGQNGILQWIQSKASDAWEWIKARIEPYKRQLMIVGGVIAGILVMISPAGPIVAIGAATVGIIRGVRWIRQHFGSGNGVVDQRSFLERTIIPGIMGTVNTVTSAVTRAATAISGKLNEVVTGMGNMVSSVAGSILRFAVGIIQWIADQIRALASWANEKLVGLADWVRNGLERLRVFLQPLLDVLGRIAEVVGNIMRLPFLLAGRLWHMIPACIRDPFINFFIPLILRRIPLFAELVATPEVWAQTRAEVMVIIRQIFRDFDLVGAMRGVFRLLLRALRVPVELAATVLRKAATAWDAVLEHPIAFLKNILRAMAQGFRLFFGGIVDHLLFGVSGWIFGELRDVGITPPASWTDLREVFGFVLRVLGISIQHIFELLARRLPPERVAQLRRIYNTLTGVWEWVKVALTEGPAGIWRMLMERLRALGNMVLEAAVTWIMERIVARVTARLLSMLDPTGIMAVVNALVSLYQAIQTVLRYARQILEILNTVLDTVLSIARGVLGPAAEMLVRALHNAMPVAIAFLANQAGLSGLGARMREIVGSIRERVDAALLWLIDRGMQAINAVLGALGVGRDSGASASFGEAADRHRVYVTEQDGRPRTIIATTPTPAMQAINTIDKRIVDEIPVPAGRATAQSLAASVRAKVTAFEAAPTAPAQGSQAYVDELARLLGPLYSLIGHPTAPETVITSSPAAHGGGYIVQAAPLTRRPPPGQIGQATTSSPIPADTDLRNLNAVRSQWVKLHLLSFRLHGQDRSWNFAPGTKAANSAMEAVESETVQALAENEGRNVLWYRTIVTYRTKTKPAPSPDETKFPQLVKMTRGPWDPITGQPKSGTRTIDIESPSPTLGAVSLSSESVEDMLAKGLQRPFAQAIFDGRTLLGRPYRSAEDIITAITLTRRFNVEREIGGQIAAVQPVIGLNTLVAGGLIVYNDQE